MFSKPGNISSAERLNSTIWVIIFPVSDSNKFKFVKFKDGKLYPPKNNTDVKLLNNTIEEYSLKKKNTKGTDGCSVKNPPTNSDS